eukprot:jgi/Astpho2/2915/e_gw1.00050.93.1_t
MNSSIQCLAHTVPLLRQLLHGRYKSQVNKNNPLGMKGELANAFGSLLDTMWQGNISYVTPRKFKAKIAEWRSQFAGYGQQDSQELLGALLDGLHEDLNRIKQKPYIEEKDADGRPDEDVARETWDNYKARNDSALVDLFQGLAKSTLVCPNCLHRSVKFDPIMYLTLPLPDNRVRTFQATVVHAYQTPEQLDKDNEWYCSKCKEHVQATKKLDIWSLPEVLVVHLKRFLHTRTRREKIETPVDFPLEGLDLTPYLLHHQDVPAVYDLYAVSNHFGGLGGGHYNAFAKQPGSDQWYCFDDSSVRQISEEQVCKASAYVFFYRRRAEAQADKGGLRESSCF